jgi:hypothetical protein
MTPKEISTRLVAGHPSIRKVAMALDPIEAYAEEAIANWPDCFLCLLHGRCRYATYRESAYDEGLAFEDALGDAGHYCDLHKLPTTKELPYAAAARELNIALGFSDDA